MAVVVDVIRFPRALSVLWRGGCLAQLLSEGAIHHSIGFRLVMEKKGRASSARQKGLTGDTSVALWGSQVIRIA
jgi:hypothetical protein